MAGPVIYVIGPILMHCPGSLNPQEAIEEFGADFAVKPVVGAQPPREFVGPSDVRLTLSGTIYPYRFAAIGVGDGQIEIGQLKSIVPQGSSVPVMRGDGTNMGWYLIEKVQLRHTILSQDGMGRRQEFSIQMVQDPDGGSADAAAGFFGGLISLL